MLPWILAAAAQLLSNKQKQREASRQNYSNQLRMNAQELGGNTRVADEIGQRQQIDSMSADYTNLLPLIGRAFGNDDEDDDDKKGGGGGVQPRSGVRLKLSDFY
jgi:hypothetical protein